MLKIIFFAILFISLAACGKRNTSSRKEVLILDEEIAEIMQNQNFECASLGGRCPSGLARLLILDRIDPNRSSVCTGFMVGKDILVTNNHCVDTNDSCKNTFIAIYNGNNYGINRCARIIKTEQDYSEPNDPRRKIDYTVMQLSEKFNGTVFQLTDKSPLPGEKLQAWVIDHTGLDMPNANLHYSRITEFECEVMDQNERESLVMMKCPIINGNSGSPALDSEGNVIGVVWGGTTLVDSNYDLELRRGLDAWGLVTESEYFERYTMKLWTSSEVLSGRY